MIYGIGTDLVEPGRVARLLARYGERFARRVLAPEELDAWRASIQPAQFLAKRFAAKEAFAKAMGTGLRDPVTLHAIRIEKDALGKPALAFGAELAAHLARQGIAGHHLSLSDEASMACAFVILERNS